MNQVGEIFLSLPAKNDEEWRTMWKEDARSFWEEKEKEKWSLAAPSDFVTGMSNLLILSKINLAVKHEISVWFISPTVAPVWKHHILP